MFVKPAIEVSIINTAVEDESLVTVLSVIVKGSPFSGLLASSVIYFFPKETFQTGNKYCYHAHT